ncbi:MAG: flagellar hook-length control protein FliK [Candidatus Accumulibacter sp.]|jgi:hypothetical protein|nr:flagellar hook-length control protein FliK [Accumulibacter sp.]
MMIPPDLAGRLQASSEVTLRPVAPVQEITDKLSGFTAGQRLMAEIQAMLPNGTYRAMINQRNITLALPFSAKSGDALELEVTESDGKLALAVVAHRGGEAGKESVSTTLSRTGQLISQLLSGSENGEKDGKALPLNGNRPLAEAPPGKAQDILPRLKEAITQSGMFYESHQAEWTEGRFTKAELLREPQGKLSATATAMATPDADGEAAPVLRTVVLATDASAEQGPSPAGQKVTVEVNPRMVALTDVPAEQDQDAPPTGQKPVAEANSRLANASVEQGASPTGQRVAAEVGNPRMIVLTDAPAEQETSRAGQSQRVVAEANSPTGQTVAPQAQGIVQHQLEALANQTFVWQGQIWPGQEMRWEIEEDGKNHQEGESDAVANWRTRLDLNFLRLGGVSARLQLQDHQVSLALEVDNDVTLGLMRSDAETLRQRLEDAGLALASLGIACSTERMDKAMPGPRGS